MIIRFCVSASLGLIADEPDMALVAEAANGREAIQQFRAHQPDVTLMDLQMPEMNGRDAMIAIRSEFPEARMLRLIAEGNTNKEIAAQLSVTEDAVKGQVRNILAKLGANDRTHAVTTALKGGIIEL